MLGTRIAWAVLAILYVVFFSWYTSCGGPLSDEEIEYYMEIFEKGAVDRDPGRLAIVREFLKSDSGDDFVMVNVIDFHETPLQVDGVAPGETSRDVLGKYMQYMLPALLSRASHPVFIGEAAADAIEMFGVEGMREWHQGAGMRYRSRRDMMDIVTNPAFQGAHDFKVSAIDKTIAFPVDPWFTLGDPRLVLLLIFLIIGLTVNWLSERSRRA